MTGIVYLTQGRLPWMRAKSLYSVPWKVAIAVWNWAKLVDAIRGALTVILASLALVLGGLLLALQRLGYLNTLALVISLVCIITGGLVLVTALSSIRGRGTEEAHESATIPFSERSDVVAASDPAADLLVEITQEDWDNFEWEAFILEIRVAITNTTNSVKKIIAYQLVTGGRNGESGVSFPTIEAHKETRRRMSNRPDLNDYSTIEPGERVVGWMIKALPWSSDPGPTPYTLTAIDELNQEYTVRRDEIEGGVESSETATAPGIFAIETGGGIGMTRIYSGQSTPDDQMLIRLPHMRITNQQTQARLSLHFQLTLPEEAVGFAQPLEGLRNGDGIPPEFLSESRALFVPLGVAPGETDIGDALFLLTRCGPLDDWLLNHGLTDLKPELKVIDYVSDRFVTVGFRGRFPEGPLPLQAEG
jgi:hypothetical protein